MRNPYAKADEEIKKLKRKIDASFHNESKLLPFDALNVTTVRKNTNALYGRLVSYCTDAYKRIAKDAYDEAVKEAKVVYPVGERKRTDAGAIVVLIYAMFHPVTGYRFTNEAKRKRDRLVESVMAATGRLGVNEAYRKSAKAWAGQSTQYADISVDEARMQAFEDCGVKHVRWVTQEDEKVCKECKERNGEIYEIHNVPSKPHYRCRCVLVPFKEVLDGESHLK